MCLGPSPSCGINTGDLIENREASKTPKAGILQIVFFCALMIQLGIILRHSTAKN